MSDLPGRADSKVALHLLDRRVLPSSKEGKSSPTQTRPYLNSAQPKLSQSKSSQSQPNQKPAKSKSSQIKIQIQLNQNPARHLPRLLDPHIKREAAVLISDSADADAWGSLVFELDHLPLRGGCVGCERHK